MYKKNTGGFPPAWSPLLFLPVDRHQRAILLNVCHKGHTMKLGRTKLSLTAFDLGPEIPILVVAFLLAVQILVCHFCVLLKFFTCCHFPRCKRKKYTSSMNLLYHFMLIFASYFSEALLRLFCYLLHYGVLLHLLQFLRYCLF